MLGYLLIEAPLEKESTDKEEGVARDRGTLWTHFCPTFIWGRGSGGLKICRKSRRQRLSLGSKAKCSGDKCLWTVLSLSSSPDTEAPGRAAICLPALPVTGDLPCRPLHLHCIAQLLMLVDARTQFTPHSDAILGTSSSLEILKAFIPRLGRCPSCGLGSPEFSSSAACTLLDYPGAIM